MKKAATILPVLAGAIWGVIGVFVRTLTAAGFDNLTLVFSRSAFATVLLFIYLFVTNRESLRIRIKDVWIFMGSGILGMLGLNVTYNVAIKTLTMSLAAVLLSLSPIFVLFISAILFKEKITRSKVLCMLMAIFGCFLASGVIEGGASVSMLGAFFGISSAFFYGLYSIFSKLATDREYGTFTIVFYSVLFVTIVTLPLSNLATIGSYVAAAPFTHMIIMIAHAMMASIIPYILYSFALIYVDAGKVSILAAGSEPTSATIFGLIFFSEALSVLKVAGLIVTITALALLVTKGKE